MDRQVCLGSMSKILDRYADALANEPGIDFDAARQTGQIVVLAWAGAIAAGVFG